MKGKKDISNHAVGVALKSLGPEFRRLGHHARYSFKGRPDPEKLITLCTELRKLRKLISQIAREGKEAE